MSDAPGNLVSISPEKALKLFGIATYDNGDWWKVTCPFHGDHADVSQAHGGINKDSGGFNCVHCKQPTDLLGFLTGRSGLPRDKVAERLNAALGKKNALLNDAYVFACHRLLLTQPQVLKKLAGKGITFEAAEKRKLGWAADEARIVIPVYDENKALRNMRKYTFEKTESNKKILNVKGAGQNRLYMIENLVNPALDTIYIAEGELKAILLDSLGFPAVSPTAGANNWEAEWNPLFKDKDVVIVYDVDEEGRKGAAKICRHLASVAKSIRDVFLKEVANFAKYTGGDITNYIVDEGKTADDFRQAVLATPTFVRPLCPVNGDAYDDADVEPIPVSLARSVDAINADKKIETEIVVSAKSDAPYILPSEGVVVCNADKDYCDFCHVAENRYYRFKVNPSSKSMMDMIDKSEAKQQEILKEYAKVYHGCKVCTIKIEESVNAEKVRAIPQIAIGASSDETVVREVYALGLGIKANTPYKILARVLASTDDSLAKLLAYRSEPTQDDIDSFELSKNLSLFQPSEWTKAATLAKLSDIYEDFESNVTRIYQRPDLHLFFDLIWHSVLYIRFQGDLVKGWVDALCIGDSGQGKSKLSQLLKEHYRCGERVDAKGSSVAGLVGGLIESGSGWMTMWGTVPLNDRRLVLIEEAKGMGADELCKMTDMRSSGVAVINKIRREATNARTRLGWISNPRGSEKLASYNFGVDAVRELFKNSEDIRRLDMVIGVASGDVPATVLNVHSADRPQCPHIYTSDLCSHLINWVWSRKDEHVIVTPEAESAILDCAKRLSSDFSDAVPIVSPADQRHKILRICAGLAGRTFSTDDGVALIVRSCHVEVVKEYLYRIYTANSLGYAEFSVAQAQEKDLSKPDEIEGRFGLMPNARDCIAALLDAAWFTWQDIGNFTDWDVEVSRQFIGYLAKRGAIKRDPLKGSYRKTAAFITLLKKMQKSDIKNVSRLDQVNKGEI